MEEFIGIILSIFYGYGIVIQKLIRRVTHGIGNLRIIIIAGMVLWVLAILIILLRSPIIIVMLVIVCIWIRYLKCN